MDHARLQPSSASRVVQCAGSLTLCEQYPQAEDNPKSIEGTLAHEVNVAVLRNLPIPAGATEEMLDGADLWCDLLAPYNDDRLHIEERVDCSCIHPLNWGTPDAWHFDRGTMVLRIWDYKFGHRYVNEYENWQLINYVAGILNGEGITGLTDQMLTVHMTIVQPRHYGADGPVRTWVVKAVDLRGHFNKLIGSWEKALLPDPPTVTGPECRDCSARHACPTLQSAGYNAVDLTGINVPFDLPADAIGLELKVMKQAQALLDARISGLEDEVLGRIKRGTAIPGWATKQGEGREKWAKPIDEVVALGELMGIDISKPSAITPKQAIKKGLPAELVATFSETPTGEIKLVPMDSTLTRRIFGEINHG